MANGDFLAIFLSISAPLLQLCFLLFLLLFSTVLNKQKTSLIFVSFLCIVLSCCSCCFCTTATNYKLPLLFSSLLIEGEKFAKLFVLCIVFRGTRIPTHSLTHFTLIFSLLFLYFAFIIHFLSLVFWNVVVLH